jgi:protein O-mannosyl-transferase
MGTRIAAGMILVMACVLVYGQTRAFDYVFFDDPEHVSENHYLQLGLSAEGIRSAFTNAYVGNRAPMTWLTYQLDYALHGYSPGGYHLGNVLFHTANSLLLFTVLLYMTGALWPAFLTALLFAVHPLHVESVAWISERKDVVCAFFWITTVGVYAWYTRKPSFLRYAAVVFALILALLSKPMAVTLPCALLLLDVWPLNRYRFPLLSEENKATALRLMTEKIPLFGAVIAVSVLTILSQDASGAVSSTEGLPLFWRLANSVAGYVAYLKLTLWPVDLIPYYPHPGDSLPLATVALAVVLLLGLTAAAVWQVNKRPWLAVGWLWFLGTLAPVIGIVQVGGQAYADRYTYIPHIGLFVAIVWGIYGWVQTRPALARGATALALTASTMLGIVAWHQTALWKNSETLFLYTLEKSPDNAAAQTGLASYYKEQGDAAKARYYVDVILAKHPVHRIALTLEGIMDYEAGDYDSAVAVNRKALTLFADKVHFHTNLGNALLAQGKTAEAEAAYRDALAIDPDHPETLSNLGAIQIMNQEFENARESLRHSLEGNANSAATYTNLAVVELRLGNREEAEKLNRRALTLDPSYRKAKDFQRYLESPRVE